MNNVLLRAISGAVYVAVIVAGILCGDFAFLVLMLLFASLAVNEFLVLTTHTAGSAMTPVDSAMLRSLDCMGAGLLCVAMWGMIPTGFFAFVLYLVLRLSLQLWITAVNPVESLSRSLMAQLYVGLPLALMAVVYRISPALLLLLFVLVWVNDTFAFLTGRSLGRHRLWERISPKKSWEGFAGGAIFTVVVATLAPVIMPATFHEIPVWAFAGLGLVTTVAATLGDLVESLIKRTVGVKDSGTLIPGHGGILDRIDSILLVVPAAVVYLTLF